MPEPIRHLRRTWPEIFEANRNRLENLHKLVEKASSAFYAYPHYTDAALHEMIGINPHADQTTLTGNERVAYSTDGRRCLALLMKDLNARTGRETFPAHLHKQALCWENALPLPPEPSAG